MLRALTVKQPYASLIVNGEKDVENRSWRTPYRGDLVIHSAKVSDQLATRVFKYTPHDTGALLGMVRLVDCVRGHSSLWAELDEWHWVLADPEPFVEFRRARGQLGVWTLSREDTRWAWRSLRREVMWDAHS
jgi:hypothetical protein